MLYIAIIAIIFAIIAIAQNKHGQYLKKSAFAVLILSMLNSLGLLDVKLSGAYQTTYLGILMTPEKAGKAFTCTLVVALLALVIYLFCDVEVG